MPDSTPPSGLRPNSPRPGPTRASDAYDLDLRELLMIARRTWRLVALCIGVCLLAGAAYLLIATPSYTASARLLIRPDAGAAKPVIRPEDEKAYIDTQVEILRGRGLADSVIREAGLSDDPELVRTGWLGRGVRGLLGWLSGRDPAETEAAERQEAIAHFVDRTASSRVGATYLIELSYTSRDRAKAARIVNALARRYTREQEAARRDDIDHTTQALTQQIERLQAQTLQAEQAVADFRTQQNAILVPAGAAADQLLDDLDRRWMAARDAAQQAQSQMQQIARDTAADPLAIRRFTLSEVPDADVVSRLAQDYATEAARLAGADPANAANLQQSVSLARRALADQIARVVAFYQDAARVARAHEASLRHDLDEALAYQNQGVARRLELQKRQSQATLLHALYEDRLRTLTDLRTQEDAVQPVAELTAPAMPPLGRSSPKYILVLGIAGFVGLAGGSGLAFLRYRLDDSLHSGAELRDALGLDCLGMLPAWPGSRRDAPALSLATLADPPPDFGETLRQIRVANDLYSEPGAGRTLGVVSAVRQEGRTTLALLLARHIARAGRKVLLVDLDAQHPQLSQELAPGAASAKLYADPQSGCDVLPCGNGSSTPQLLKETLAPILAGYDDIIVDLPACTARMDILAATALVSRFVMVIAAGQTSRASVAEALKANPVLAGRLLGAVLNGPVKKQALLF